MREKKTMYEPKLTNSAAPANLTESAANVTHGLYRAERALESIREKLFGPVPAGSDDGAKKGQQGAIETVRDASERAHRLADDLQKLEALI